MSLGDLRPGDRVVCVNNVGVETYLDVGREYEVREASEHPSNGYITILSGGSFGKNRFARLLPMGRPVHLVDYRKLHSELRTSMEEVDHALSNQNLGVNVDGPWGRVGRINKLSRRFHESQGEARHARSEAQRHYERNCVLHKEVEALQDTISNYRKGVVAPLSSCAIGTKPEMVSDTAERVVAEHKRMKRQLELFETYNFDRDGVDDATTVREFYNYAMVGLGKKTLTTAEWCAQRIKTALYKLKRAGKMNLWRTPIFESDLGSLRFFYATQKAPAVYSYSVTSVPDHCCEGPCKGHPVQVPDEKHSHQADAYSPTGCGKGCLHPDCKDSK